MHEIPLWVKLAADDRHAAGLRSAPGSAYIRDTSIPGKFVEQLGPVYRFVYNKWYFDELYDLDLRRPAFWLGRQFWKIGDVGIIDRFGPNGAAWVVAQGRRSPRSASSPAISTSYALIMLLGLVAAVTWVMVVMGGFPILSVMLLVPLVGALSPACSSRRRPRAAIALGATLIDLALGIVLWANYDIGGAQWQFTERVPLFAGFNYALGHRRHRADADRADASS